MANPTKPTIVIICGGWHQPISYSKLTRALEKASFEVVVPALPTVSNARPPTKDMKDDIAAIRDTVTSLCNAGKLVIALMHSYGGQVGTSALTSLSLTTRSSSTPSLPGGVIHLIYMTASALPEGTSMIDKVAEFNHLDLMPQAFDFADDQSVVSRYPKHLLIGPLPDSVSSAEADAYIATWLRWNGECMYQKAIEVGDGGGGGRCAWRDIPVTYLYASNDMTLPLDYQKSMTEVMKKEGVEVDEVTIEAGHCPNLTATGEVVHAVVKVVEKCMVRVGVVDRGLSQKYERERRREMELRDV